MSKKVKNKTRQKKCRHVTKTNRKWQQTNETEVRKKVMLTEMKEEKMWGKNDANNTRQKKKSESQT